MISLTEDGDYYNMGAGAVTVGGKRYVRDLDATLAPAAAAAAAGSILISQPLTDWLHGFHRKETFRPEIIVTFVPEPRTYALFACLGLIGFMAYRAARKQA